MSRRPLPGTFEHLVRTVSVPAASLVRLSLQPMREPYWGKDATHRFDDPTGTFGVLYAGDSLATAFAESVIHENARFDPAKGTFQVAAGEFERAVTTFAAPS